MIIAQLKLGALIRRAEAGDADAQVKVAMHYELIAEASMKASKVRVMLVLLNTWMLVLFLFIYCARHCTGEDERSAPFGLAFSTHLICEPRLLFCVL